MTRISRLLMGGAAAVALLSASHAVAQDEPENEAILYGKGHYRGPGYRLSGPTRPIDPAFVAKSVRIPPGQVWEFCTGRTFTGCRELTQSEPATIMNVRSARPVASVIQGDAPTVAATGQSLRGFASEFFVTPEQGGNRLEVSTGTGEEMTRQAVEFCRTKGWRSAAYARLQSLGGRYYLADVLCSDTPE